MLLRVGRVVSLLLALLLAWGCYSPRKTLVRKPADWEDALSTASREQQANARAAHLAAAHTAASTYHISTNATLAVRSASPREKVETWISLDELSQTYHWNPPIRQELPPPLSYALSSIHGVLLLRAGAKSALWQGVDVRLGFAPIVINQQILVNRLDVEKTLHPLLSGENLMLSASTPMVVIDPGHGGADPGTHESGGKQSEKDFTLDWARRLAEVLRTSGWQVWMTRSNDVEVSLSNRVAIAEQHPGGLFISLHFNYAPGSSTQAGVETYCLTPTGMPSSLTRDYRDDPTDNFPNNAFDEQNLLLALGVHREILKANGGMDRGVRRARFPKVLQGQHRPAVLIEGGYLSNREEARLISMPQFRQSLAQAVAAALRPMLLKLTPEPISAGPHFIEDPAPSAVPPGSTSSRQ